MWANTWVRKTTIHSLAVVESRMLEQLSRQQSILKTRAKGE